MLERLSKSSIRHLRVKVLLSVMFGSMAQAHFSERSQLLKEGEIPFKDIQFYYQPYEDAGTSCKFSKLEASHDYLVYCGQHEFSVHFFARPYKLQRQDATEILLMLTDLKAKSNASNTVSVWVKNAKGSETQEVFVSLGVQKDTASLDVRAFLR